VRALIGGEMDTVTEVGIWLMACAIGGVIGAIGGVIGTVIYHATRVTVAWIIAKIRGRG